jgi:hypothetical protein
MFHFRPHSFSTRQFLTPGDKAMRPNKLTSTQPYKEKVMQVQQRLKCLVVTLVALTLSMVARAQVHQQIPEDIQPPVYAALDRGFMPHTEEWAVVIFYRNTDCVPADFNLLDLIDPPPRPFLCALQIEGHSNWRSLDDPYPSDSLFQGTGAVPLWFVRWPELQEAVADDELTIAELAALPSLLKGSASFFLESIRNDIRGQRGGNEAVVAGGSLTDGRTFQVEFTEKFREGQHLFPHIRIDFK